MPNSREEIKRYAEDFGDQYFIVFNYLNQYTEGITGGTRTILVLAGEGDQGFKRKSDARKYFSTVKTNYKSVTTQKNQGYGALGHFYSKPEFIKGRDLIKKISEDLFCNIDVRIINVKEKK